MDYYCGLNSCPVSFNEYPGGTTCSACFAGQELQSLKSIRNTGCVDCKPGYYAYTPGNYTSYGLKGWSSYYKEQISEKCEECPSNTYSGPRAAVCTTCPPGTTNNAARTACEPTSNPPPTRSPTTATPTVPSGLLSKCSPGQGLASGGNGDCYDCLAGWYSPFGVECLMCPRGTYSSGIRSAKCTQVPSGQVVNEKRTGGVTCEAGYYAPNLEGPEQVPGRLKVFRLKDCTKCPPNMYSKAGEDICHRCADGTEVSIGKDDCSPCKANFYKGSTTPTCLSCPDGTYSAEKSSMCLSCPTGSKLNPARTGCTTV